MFYFITAVYIVKQKTWKLFEQKNVKITKQAHAFKGYASSYTVKILIFFNLGLQIKDTEAAIKAKLKNLLTELREFKLMTTFLEFIKERKRW